MIELTEITFRDEETINALFEVWKESVKATHTFLSEQEIDRIAAYVPMALREVPSLIAAVNPDGIPVAFMGIDQNKLEMLFISPAERGKGIGKQLLKHGIEAYSVNELCVNEQNPQARGFYEHMGFEVYKRTDVDEQGGPYPLLYMKLSGLNR